MNDKKMNLDIWKNLSILPWGNYVGEEIDANTYGFVPLLQAAINQSSGCVYKAAHNCSIKETPIQEHVDYLIQQGGRMIFQHDYTYGIQSMWIWPDGLLSISCSKTNVGFNIFSHDAELVKNITTHFKGQSITPKKTGHIYAIMSAGGTLQLRSLGDAGIQLEAGNYSDKVMTDYRFVIKDLQSSSPSGRVVIMRGTPGTGKTHLVRAMLLEVPDAMFVLFSPDVITELAGPQLLPLLLNQRGSSAGPIILVLEDADKCLVARDANNINSIQSLLNLGDGILGSMLDLRIVATTNAHELHMEEALMRKGRLSCMLEVGKLNLTTTRGIINRLIPNKTQWIGEQTIGFDELTLAEVYSKARELGWEPQTRQEQSTTVEDGNDDLG